MKRSLLAGFSGLVLGGIGAVSWAAPSGERASRLPPLRMAAAPEAGHRASAVFAGGCFWGVQSVFQHVRGVLATRVGYDGGPREAATYEIVGSGRTGHAESVEVIYDPAQVSYAMLMRLFFSVALDPTQVNGQFPDQGSQYRSVLFTRTAAQAAQARAYIHQLDAAHVFARPVATQVVPDHGFYSAEAYHQNFAALYPDNPYIARYDAPHVAALKALFPAASRSRPVLALTPADGT